jgi:Domain of unknown function (DUF4259)
MGAWDLGSFDNDDASDWLCELEGSSDTSLISTALHRVTEIGDGYLESPDCCNALAAAEIVAALRGHPMTKLPDIGKEWVAAHRNLDSAQLVSVALAALDRIRANSELKELWDEVSETPKWLVTVDDLKARLHAAQPRA